jgi:hypothetical protein
VKPLRRHVALAVDGGGIRGAMVTRALSMLEDQLGTPCPELFTLVAGTSTGSVIAAGIGAGITAQQMHALYRELGGSIFRKSCRSRLWPLTRYRYPIEPLREGLQHALGDLTLGDLWSDQGGIDLVITAYDLVEQRTRFIKPWKPEYAQWPLATAVLASCAVPTYFPVVEGRYVDGGVGSYANPCYLAAYEIAFCLGWDPAETTLISLGTGRAPRTLPLGGADRLRPWQWLGPVLDAFGASAQDQQVHLVETFFGELDFRRFQVDLEAPIAMDDASALDLLESYGERLGQKLLNDELDQAQFVTAPLAPGYRQPEPTDLLKPQPSRPSSLPLWLVMGGSLIGLWRQLRKH